jgi:hypothetical protein
VVPLLVVPRLADDPPLAGEPPNPDPLNPPLLAEQLITRRKKGTMQDRLFNGVVDMALTERQ